MSVRKRYALALPWQHNPASDCLCSGVSSLDLGRLSQQAALLFRATLQAIADRNSREVVMPGLVPGIHDLSVHA